VSFVFFFFSTEAKDIKLLESRIITEAISSDETIHTFSEITPKMRTKYHGNKENLGHSHWLFLLFPAPSYTNMKLPNKTNSMWLMQSSM